MNWVQALILAFAALLGSALAGYFAWLQTTQPFDWRQYQLSLIAGLFAALVWVAKYQVQSEFGWLDIVSALIFGAGADHIANISSGIQQKYLLGQISALRQELEKVRGQIPVR